MEISQNNIYTNLPFQGRLYAIDFLKLVSAAVIFLFHCNMHLGIQFKSLTPFISQGAVVMDLFFMLSGFALYYGYLDTPLSGSTALAGFYRKRLFAIYPLYLVIMLVFLLVMDPASLTQKILELPIQLLLLQSWFSGLFSYSHNGGTWFLSCLAFCYLLFPLLKVPLERAGKRRVCMLLALVYLLCAVSPHLVIACELPNIYSSPLLRMLQFFAGMLTAALVSQGNSRVPKISPFSWGVLALGSAAALVGMVSWFVRQEYCLGHYVPYGFVTFPLFLFLLTGAVQVELGRSSAPRWGVALKTLSGFAYPIFMAQFFLWPPMRKLISARPQWFVSHGNWKTFLLATLLCAVVTLALYLFDTACQRLLKKQALS